MGSTRQIFSEDRHQTSDITGLCPRVATNTKIHLIIEFFWYDRFTTNRKYLNNREIFETALSESFKKKIGKSEHQMKTWKIFVYYFFATLLDISTTESVCCCL